MRLFLTAAANAAADTAEAPNPVLQILPTILMLVAVVAIFYFLMYRPQKKQEKETKSMLDNLQVGDEITTIGGIIGKIISIKDETVLIETSRDCTKIRILRTAVRHVDVHAEDAE